MPSGYSTDAGGGVLTQEQVAALLVEPLLARAVVLEAGPQVFVADGVPLRIPRIDALALADAWRAENTAIAEADPTYDELVLLPSTLKSVKTVHRISNELARNAVGNVAGLLSAALVTRVANVLDTAFLVGDGTSNTVLGMANQTGVQTITAVGAPAIDDLYDAEGRLMAANGDPATAAWFMAPRDLTAFRKQREGAGTGAYLLQPSPTEAGRMTLLGHPVFVSTQIPINLGAGTNESKIILADMAQVAVARDADVQVKILEERYGDYDQIGIRVTARFDIGLLNPEGVVVLTGVTP